MLLSRGSITLVYAAPLSDMMPGWTVRTERLDACGIDTIMFIEWEPEDICHAVLEMHDVRWSPKKVEQDQERVRALLGIGQVAVPSG
jgi:hypothetical protein